jgi:peptidoglycan/LPS O-acetylase OafA/YrhL
MQKIHTLTGLRFLAAFYVFVFHVNMPIRTPLTWLPRWTQTIIDQGFLGVTLFFVLSGFVLTYSHQKDFSITKMPSIGYWFKFLYKRLARIYPPFIVGLLVLLVLSIRLKSVPPWWLAVMSATFTQTYHPGVAMLWYDGGAWSVANEWFFYLLFPLLLPLAVRYLRSSRAVALALCGVIMLQAGLAFALYLHPAWSRHIYVFCFPPARLPEFMAGILVANGVLRFSWRIPAWLAIVAVTAEAGWLAFTPSAFIANRMLHHMTFVPALVLLLIALTGPRKSAVFGWLAARPLQYLGEISYCFYIIQIPLSFFLEALLSKGTVQHTNMLVFPVGLTINLIAAAALHHFVENPAHAWLMQRYASRNARLSLA